MTAKSKTIKSKRRLIEEGLQRDLNSFPARQVVVAYGLTRSSSEKKRSSKKG